MGTGIIGMFSLVEWLIFAFIGANLTLAGVCVVQRGVKRIGGSTGDFPHQG